MDKDDFLKILESFSCFHLGNYFTEDIWAEQCALASISTKEEHLQENPLTHFTLENEEQKQNKEQANLIKYFSSALEEFQFYEKIRKENESLKIENISKFASNQNINIDEFYEKKIHFFENLINSYALNKYKTNKLTFLPNPKLETFSTKLNLFQEICPGLKPASNWPVSLDDLLQKLTETSFDEIFHQPFDICGSVHSEGLNVIKTFFSFSTSSSDEAKIYKDYLIKAIQASLSLSILEGNFKKLYNCLKVLRSLFLSNKNFFNEIFQLVMTEKSSYVSPLNQILGHLLDYLKENNSSPYPIMRNYSFVDYFNISKNVLFAQTKFAFNLSSSVCCDSKFLYLVICGVNGGIMKVGTGYDGTTKGKVYHYEKLNINEASFQIVHCREKIYAKINSGGNKENTMLTLVNKETLKPEGNVKLVLPETASHPLIKKRNENFVLLSDGLKIYALALEPVLKNDKPKSDNSDDELVDETSQFENLIKNQISKAKKKDQQLEQMYPEDVFKYLNLVLYTFNIDNEDNLSSIKDKEKIANIEEVYSAFAQNFTKEECKKALMQNNWNVLKTSMYLIDNQEEIKQPFLIPSHNVTLIQTKILQTFSRSGRADFKIPKNSIFDVTQFDLLKWSVSDDLILGYKLKDGTCFLFCNDDQPKTFSYSYKEKILINNKSQEKPAQPQYIQGFNAFSEQMFLEQQILEEHLREIKEKCEGIAEKSKKGGELLTKELLNLEAKLSKISRDNKKKDEFVKKLHQIKSKKEEPQPQHYEEKSYDDEVCGTYIKSLSCLQISKHEPIFCFDNKRKIYFLVASANLTSQSVMVSNTFQQYANIISSSNESMKYFEKNKFDNFEDFYSNMLQLLMLMNIKKWDGSWKYHNWNYFYSTLIENYLNQRELLCEQTFICGDPHFPSLTYERPVQELNIKALTHRIEKLAEKDEDEIKSQIPYELSNKSKLEGTMTTKKRRASSSKSNYTKRLESSSWGFWSNDTVLEFKPHETKAFHKDEFKNSIFFLTNRKEFYLIPDGEIETFSLIIEEISNCINDEHTLEINLNFLLFCFMNTDQTILLNSTKELQFSEVMSKLKLLFTKILIKDKPLLNFLVYKNILTSWELAYRTFEEQFAIFELFYAIPGFELNYNPDSDLMLNILTLGKNPKLHPLHILLQKISISNLQFNTFERINIIKAYLLCASEDKTNGNIRMFAKPQWNSVGFKNFSVPFHWGLLGEVLYEDNVSERQDDDEVKKQTISLKHSLIPEGKASYLFSPADKFHNKKFVFHFPESEISKDQSEKFWMFLIKKIKNVQQPSSEFYLNLLIDLYCSCIGDLNEFATINSEHKQVSKINGIYKQYSGNNKSQFIINEKYFAFCKRNIEIIKELIPLNNSISMLNYTKCVFYSIFSKIRQCPVSTLQNISTDIMQTLTQLVASTNFTKQQKLLQTYSELIVNKTNKEFCFDHVLTANDITTFAHSVKFEGTSLVCVEIECKSAKEHKPLQDILIVSSQHSFENLKYNTNNNQNKFGTCFQMKLLANLRTKFYLPGDEIKISSPSEFDLTKLPSRLGKNQIQFKSSGTSNLRIKACPFSFFNLNLPIGAKEFKFFELVKEFDYSYHFITKLLIASFDISKDEKDFQILKEPSMKLKRSNYSEISQQFEEYTKSSSYHPENFGIVCKYFNTVKELNENCENIFDRNLFRW